MRQNPEARVRAQLIQLVATVAYLALAVITYAALLIAARGRGPRRRVHLRAPPS